MKLLGMIGLLLFSVNTFAAYNNGSFKGSFSFRLTGTSSIVLANQATTVATGIIIADGKGGVTGHGSFRTAGITCIGTIKGIYHIDADGTGFLASNLSTSTPGCFTSVLDVAIVLADSGNRFEVSNNENDYLAGTLIRQVRK